MTTNLPFTWHPAGDVPETRSSTNGSDPPPSPIPQPWAQPFPPPFHQQPPIPDITPRRAPQLNVNTRAPDDLDSPDPEWDASINAAEICSLSEANILTSEAQDRPGIHKFMIDVDLPVVLVPSTTPGHSHLYIDVDIEWPRYVELLRALALAGVIEVGYARASIHRGYTSLRPPWVTKTDDEKGSSR